MMMEGDKRDTEIVTNTKELFNKINHTLQEYKPYEICMVCMGVIVDLINSVPIDEREELQSDIVSMIDTEVKHVSKRDSPNNNEPKTSKEFSGEDITIRYGDNMTINKPNGMLDEIEPIVIKYEPSVVCAVCISVLGSLVHTRQVNKREALRDDITIMIEDTVKRLDMKEMKEQTENGQ